MEKKSILLPSLCFKRHSFIFLLFFAIIQLSFLPGLLAQQGTRVSGIVKGANDESLPGVSVTVKGGTTATYTDTSGSYSILVPGSRSVLVYSFIGFASKEEVVGSRTFINVNLEHETSTLEDVVVIGY